MKIDDLIKDYKEIRRRLIRPPNAVHDDGIDLTRKSTAYKGDVPPPGTPPKKALPGPHLEITLPINFEDIVSAVSAFYGIPIEDLKGDRRHGHLVLARKVIVHLSLKLITIRSLSSIARGLNKDHTTIVHARRKIIKNLKESELLRSQVRIIEESILAKYRDRSAVPSLGQCSLALQPGPGPQVQALHGLDR